MNRPLVVLGAAPNGGRRSRAEHSAVPLTAAELARTAAECGAAGAALLHFHVRDSAGAHLLDATAYREALAAIRQEAGPGLFLQITSESLGRYAPAEQMAVVRATRPEGVSLALREVLPPGAEVKAFAEFLLWLRRERIAPQFILYTPEEAVRLADLCRAGAVPWDAPPVLFALGRYQSAQVAAPAMLLPFLGPAMPVFADWMACAFGPDELGCVTAAALLGGHARVGFENNLHLPDGTLAPDNAALVRATTAALAAPGRRPMTGDQLRARWTPP